MKAFNDAVSSLESRVLVTVRKMGELGARTEKEVPTLEYIERKSRELAAPVKVDQVAE